MKNLKCKQCDTPTLCSEDTKKVTCSSCVNINISKLNGVDYEIKNKAYIS